MSTEYPQQPWQQPAPGGYATPPAPATGPGAPAPGPVPSGQSGQTGPYPPTGQTGPYPPTGPTGPNGPNGPYPPNEPNGAPEPSRQRSWFARHKVLTAVGAVVAIGIVGAALSPGGEDDPAAAGADETVSTAEPPAPQETATEPAAADEGAEATEAAQATEPAAQDRPVEEPAASAPGIGDPARDGEFEFVVTGIEPGVERIGGEYLQQTAQGQYVLVHLDVTNIGSSAQTLFDSAQALIDTEGREHSADSSAGIYLEDNEMWISDVNPGNTLSGTLVFDIPADAVPDRVVLHDSLFSGGVEVSLS